MSTTMWMSMTWLQTFVISFAYGWTRTYLWREHLPPLLRNLKRKRSKWQRRWRVHRTVQTKSNFKGASNEYRQLNTCAYSASRMGWGISNEVTLVDTSHLNYMVVSRETCRIRLFSSNSKRRISTTDLYKVHVSRVQFGLCRNPKSFWSFVNSQRKTLSVPKVVFDNRKLISAKEACYFFVKYFASVYEAGSSSDIEADLAASNVALNVVDFLMFEITPAMGFFIFRLFWRLNCCEAVRSRDHVWYYISWFLYIVCFEEPKDSRFGRG